MNTNALEVYKKSVTSNFAFLKSASNIQEAYLRAIPIGSSGFLVPVCRAHESDSELIQKLTAWRNTNVHVYPTQFVATIESTKAWLATRLLDVADRILFLVVDNIGKSVGHIGLSGCHNDDFLFEIDNVVRGDPAADKGLFSRSINTLIHWARTTLPVEGFFLRVMDDNPHAIDFYKRNGFVENCRISLTMQKKTDFTSYTEARADQHVSKQFVRMGWQANSDAVGRSLILTAGPSISAREAVYSFDAARNGWNRNWSKYLTAFENQFAAYVGVDYAIATSSCTGALQIALMALGVGPDDEVIVPDQTWVATANAVRYVGAIPKFADVELDTWNIDVKSIEALVTGRTKAIIPVHMYGHPARMDAIAELAKKYHLNVIEDAAPAIGAEWGGKRCGTFGDFAAFSFQGAKLLVTGEGGMLVTNDAKLYEKARKIWDQGRNPSRAFWIDEEGVKFKMSNIQAALGLAQLERVDELIEMKRRVFSWYEEALDGVPFITLNKEVDGARSIYWMSSLFLDERAPMTRDQLINLLKARNVDTRPVFPAISQYPIWQTQQRPQPTALRVGQQAMNLPSGVCLSKDEVSYVAEHIRQILSTS